MKNKRISLKRLLIIGFILIVLLTSASFRSDMTSDFTPHEDSQIAAFTQSITLGETDASFTLLLNKIIVLYLRNQGIHVKELNFKEPSRLPLALKHKVVDTYWEISSRPPQEADHGAWLVSRPTVFVRENTALADVKSLSDLLKHKKEKGLQLKIAVGKKVPLDQMELEKIKQAFGEKLHQDDFVQIDHSLLARALQEQWVDIAIGWSSDVRFINEHTHMLQDDLGIIPSYQMMPRFHESTRALLEPHFRDVMERLTMEKWLELQYHVEILGEDVSKVAMQFLVQERLMKLNPSE